MKTKEYRLTSVPFIILNIVVQCVKYRHYAGSSCVYFRIPIRIVHGLSNSEVKVDDMRHLLRSLTSGDVDLLFRKDGDHEMDKYQDWELYMNTIDR